MASLTEAHEIIEVFQFMPSILVGPVMRHKIELAVTGLAPEARPLLHLELNLLPVVRFEVLVIPLL